MRGNLLWMTYNERADVNTVIVYCVDMAEGPIWKRIWPIHNLSRFVLSFSDLTDEEQQWIIEQKLRES